jgi:predicted SprT family Zn-dependent metalloprotease
MLASNQFLSDFYPLPESWHYKCSCSQQYESQNSHSKSVPVTQLKKYECFTIDTGTMSAYQ